MMSVRLFAIFCDANHQFHHFLFQSDRRTLTLRVKSAPGALDALDPRLATEDALGADLERDPGHFGRERAELVDHGVDCALERGHLALDLDLDLLREIAFGDGRGDLGDGPDLICQTRAHSVAWSLSARGNARGKKKGERVRTFLTNSN